MTSVTLPVHGDGRHVGSLHRTYTAAQPTHSAECHVCVHSLDSPHFSFGSVTRLLAEHVNNEHGVEDIEVDLRRHMESDKDRCSHVALASLAKAWGDGQWAPGSLWVRWQGPLRIDRDGVVLGYERSTTRFAVIQGDRPQGPCSDLGIKIGEVGA